MQDVGSGEDCVHYQGTTGKWNDHKCSMEFKYICGPLPTSEGNKKFKNAKIPVAFFRYEIPINVKYFNT